ncbi:unnamed protein product [Mycena citricolor]|uniref:lytic cellulose monooxygenase (C4-dehydrogenating) n=1 Tax=Mycena citricolor TaxID=2018698 RepID=A0AAD2HB44_9AGAR|nr:unnamed protein product [Mycena citricolor]
MGGGCCWVPVTVLIRTEEWGGRTGLDCSSSSSSAPMPTLRNLLCTALLSAAAAHAHYIFPNLTIGGVTSANWANIRQTNNWQALTPQQDVTVADIRCYDSAFSNGIGTATTTKAAAGSAVTFNVFGNPSNLYHPGVLNVYMAKAPTGTDVSKWDPTGAVWFKVYQISAVTDGGSTITFPATGLASVTFNIPSATPSGQYLIRIEHIALHSASSYGGAQFYISCAQVEVTGGGSGTPGPLVAFPGAYTGNVRNLSYRLGLLTPVCARRNLESCTINIYYPIPATYTQPGPAVWPAGSGSGSGSGGSTSTTTARPPPPSSTTTSKGTTSTTAPPTSTGGTVAQFGQCGGSGYAGSTVCAAPYKCTVLNPYYSQCT